MRAVGPDERAARAIEFAEGLSSGGSRLRLVTALDASEPGWDRAMVRLEPEVVRALQNCGVDELDKVVAYAGWLCAVYDLPFVNPGMLAVALALTSELPDEQRVGVADVMAECFDLGTLEDLPEAARHADAMALVLESDAPPPTIDASSEPLRSDREVVFFELACSPPAQTWTDLCVKVFGGVRVVFLVLMIMAVVTPTHWYLTPLAVLAGLVVTRHPYDRSPLLARLGVKWERTRVMALPVQGVICAVATLVGCGSLALLVALMTMFLELVTVAGESGRARGTRFETVPPHPFSVLVTRVPRLGFVLDSDRHAARVVLGYLCATVGLVAAALVAPVPLLAAGALLLTIASTVRGRFGLVLGMIAVLLSAGVPIVSVATALPVGAVGYAVVRGLHRIPVERIPVPVPRRDLVLWRARRLIGRGLVLDAMRMLDGVARDRDDTAIAVLLLRAYARMREQRPRSALAELDELRTGERTAWLRLDAHQRAIVAVIEVNSRLDLLDAPGARQVGEELIAYRNLARCHVPLLRECLLAEARLLREDPEAPCGGPLALALVERLARALPRHPLWGGTPVCARLIAAAAQTAATVHTGAATALMAITFTTAGFGGYGDDRGFSRRHSLEDFAMAGTEPPTDVYSIEESQLDLIRERELLFFAWLAGCRRLPEFGPLSSFRSRWMAQLLDRYIESFGDIHKGRRTRLSMYRSYFEGLSLVDGGDLANGFSALCLSSLQNLRARETLGHPVLPRALEVLATQHLRFGVYDVAAEGLWNAYSVRRDSRSRDAELTLARLCVAAARADHREALAFVIDELEGRVTEFAHRIRSLARLLAEREAGRPGELDAALTGMRSVSLLAYAYAVARSPSCSLTRTDRPKHSISRGGPRYGAPNTRSQTGYQPRRGWCSRSCWSTIRCRTTTSRLRPRWRSGRPRRRAATPGVTRDYAGWRGRISVAPGGPRSPPRCGLATASWSQC